VTWVRNRSALAICWLVVAEMAEARMVASRATPRDWITCRVALTKEEARAVL